VTWDWDFGDGNFSSLQNPSHQYETPGTKNVVLTVVDNNDCVEQFEFEFLWAPAPSQVIVQPSSFIACSPGGSVTFTNLSFPIDSTYDVTWDFGDGNMSKEISPTYEYTEDGTFTVSVNIISPFGCEIGRTFNNWITIKPGPTADFTFSPDIVTNFSPEVSFFDQSTPDVDTWQWDFSGQGASRDQNPTFTFRDTGLQEIVLLVTAENGCVDTAFVILDVIPINSYHLPNAFTPNNDDTNDVYMGVGTLANITDFNMKIFDRWGELIYDNDDQFMGWNGRKNNAGPLLPAGVYVKAYATLIR
jgi:gliding motility-associated-like protein